MTAPRAQSPAEPHQRHAKGRKDTVFGLEQDAHTLAERLPDLLVDASRIAQTITHGIHGRRRSGPGETFWQFRQYSSQDSAHLIDWRRSASSDHLYVREREWEAAHTLWLWPDLSQSMNFKSHISATTKRDRALILTLALSELLVRSGERVGLMGLMRPSASRSVATKLAETIATDPENAALTGGTPRNDNPGRFSTAILISDFLDPISSIRKGIEPLAAGGMSGHLIQVLDPAEETLPYEGRTEFLEMETGESWLADRAETLRQSYQERLASHRQDLIDLATRFGWTFMVHHTDRPASEPLLSLIMRLEGRDSVSPSQNTSTRGLAQTERATPVRPAGGHR